MPQISVIVPVYNVEEYIHRCVDSILNQTFRDIELILVDDGSPDNCGVICDEYARKDSRVTVIHQENGGLSAARNAGIAAAGGEYFCFVDSDDVIHPDCLRILMTCIKNTGAEIALGRFDRFHGDRVSAECFVPWDEACLCKTNLETLDGFFGNDEKLPSLVSACGKLWHRDLFDGITFPVGRLFEDEFTTYKFYHKARKIAFVEMPLYFYFVNESGITGSLTLEKRFDEYDAQWERLLYFREQNMTDLLGKAAMTFLKTAQWDLIACREKKEAFNPEKKKKLEICYAEALRTEKRLGLLDFLRYYDYYVLAFPQYTLFLRIKRQILLRLCKRA